MRHRRWFEHGLVAAFGVVWLLVGSAITQELPPTSFRDQLEAQQAELRDERERPALARQLVRERMGAARESREKLIPIARGGRWRSDGAGRTSESWYANLHQNTDDGTISGRLNIVGSRLFTEGKVSGRVDGTSVSGVVTAEDGTQLATFSGTVSGSTMSGTYQTSDGDVGTWGD
jgi:hypothetical protein